MDSSSSNNNLQGNDFVHRSAHTHRAILIIVITVVVIAVGIWLYNGAHLKFPSVNQSPEEKKAAVIQKVIDDSAALPTVSAAEKKTIAKSIKAETAKIKQPSAAEKAAILEQIQAESKK